MRNSIIRTPKHLLTLPLLIFLVACQEDEDLLPEQKQDYTYIFWTSIGDHAILRATLDPQLDSILAIDTLFNHLNNVQSPTAVVADPASETLYWTDYSTQQILRGSWNGRSAPQVLYSMSGQSNAPVELTFDATKQYLYWTQTTANRILGAPVTGGGAIDTLFSEITIDGPWGISIQASQQYLYWIEYNDTELHRAALQTGIDKILYAGGSGFLRPYGLAIDNTDIYIIDNTIAGAGVPDRILKGSTQGAPLSALYSTGVSNAYNLAIDNLHNGLYWLNQLEQGGIWKASTDGTAIPREIIPGIIIGQGLAIANVTKKTIQ